MTNSFRSLIVATVVASPVALAGADADAAVCDQLLLGADNQDVILGEAGYRQCVGGPSPFCYFQPYGGSPKLGACWRDEGGAWQLEILDCTGANTSSDIFYFKGGAGDDRVAVLRDEHTTGDLTLLPAGGGTGAMMCGGSDAIAPWNPNFDFQIYAYLGTGTDVFHGSDNRDFVMSNDFAYVGGTWTSPADNAFDLACMYGGNDTFYGDADDDYHVAEDLVDGGAGTDYCDGDYGFDGSDYDDLYLSCETHYDLYSAAGTGWIDCTEDDDPIHEW